VVVQDSGKMLTLIHREVPSMSLLSAWILALSTSMFTVTVTNLLI
jgi:hypothetical protein